MRLSRRMGWIGAGLALLAGLSGGAAKAQTSGAGSRGLRFEITLPAEMSGTPMDGHILLGIAQKSDPEPRFQLDEQEAESAQFFGLDVEDWKPGTAVVVDGSALGYPLKSLRDLPAGDYTVQAVLNVYEVFHRADGHVVKLPPDRGEGQQWYQKPGNLMSKPMRMHLDASQGGEVKIRLDEKMKEAREPQDSKYVKHVKIQSKLLSEFWGRPVFLGATVLLPEGFEEHPDAKYPLVIWHGHFEAEMYFFKSEPPKDRPEGAWSYEQFAHRFYQDWTSGRLPHVLLVTIQHANPYYDDSYAVNSANLGPYGDAIVQEVIPEVEAKFRGIGQPWARGLVGGSTGGWEVLADQIFYPDFFNGAYSYCPDPIDFRAYQLVNLYEDKNAFWTEGPFGKVPRSEMRNEHGQVLALMEPAVRREEVMGTHGRSTDQFGIWQAVFSPAGADGYPKPIWNPATGAIDPEVAVYWREHYDLRYILQRDITKLGPKLAGKIHFAVGDMDTWYLNNAVHRMQEFVDSAQNPYRIADFEYSPGKAHCYMGGGDISTLESNGTVFQRVLPEMTRHMAATAPEKADMSWKY